ncbi:hypothetical protein [Prosthecobacter vanneervenii]|uniref:DNA-binding MarR family transcriptional regulator n=1 Tax=Prosthecobacter vanneervenii TaxID=48466 RepID=A0A7W7YBN9_9BACT|nr:hypothetical protein [Prosthecobacter vanneervenii]MBB5033159.1 DNA-binding MarR family transcriptional regulator [Prosthecobacter vanneervenii]
MNLQIEIIRILREAVGHPLLLSVLRAQVDVRVRPRPLKAVVDDALSNLSAKGYIIESPNELDDADPYYQLDEKGEAFAAKQRL